MPPPLSIVLPAWNAAATIERAIRSVLASTFADFELLVIDDGSSDGTCEIVESINDPRLRLIRQEHLGVAATANRGTAEAQAPFIARMDADDYCHPQRFEQQLALVDSENLDGAGGLVRIVDANGEPVPTMQRYEEWVNDNRTPEAIAAWRFVESPLVNPTVLAKREVFELGYRAGDFPEDYDLWLRAIGKGYRFAKVPEVIHDWTDGPTRLTRSNPAYSEEAFNHSRLEHLLAGPLHGVDTIDVWGAGATGKPWLRWLQAASLRIRHLVEVSPKKIGEKIHGVRVRAPEDLPPADGTPLIVAVGAPGARELILAALMPLGYKAGDDAWFVA